MLLDEQGIFKAAVRLLKPRLTLKEQTSPPEEVLFLFKSFKHNCMCANEISVRFCCLRTKDQKQSFYKQETNKLSNKRLQNFS